MCVCVCVCVRARCAIVVHAKEEEARRNQVSRHNGRIQDPWREMHCFAAINRMWWWSPGDGNLRTCRYTADTGGC